MKNILDITRGLNIPDDKVIPYGWDKAKIDLSYKDQLKDKKNGKLVLVTAITPTKAGEGKTTTTIGLHDGLRRIGVNSLAVLREPSLGPVFGVKGGAVGALKSTIVPSDDINLHFTGDFHALTSTINLIAAMIENHIYQGNELNIDPHNIVWTRALDMNDRSIRSVLIDSEGNGADDDTTADSLEKWCKNPSRYEKHKSEFVITVASELMAIFCIANDEEEFLDRTEDIIVAYTGCPVNLPRAVQILTKATGKNYDYLLEASKYWIRESSIVNRQDLARYKDGLISFEEIEKVDLTPYINIPIRVRDLHIRGAIKKLMHTAMNPNIVQTLEENPVLVHGGPFANIAHGCNSVIATKLGLKLADVVVTEAGFGADLGAEKFLDIKCQRAGLAPDAIVLVATVRALKSHGGIKFEDLNKENVEAMKVGACNLWKHKENMDLYGVPVVIAINRFPSDTDAEVNALMQMINEKGYWGCINTGALDGSEGAEELAKQVSAAIELDAKHLACYGGFEPLYPINDNGWSIKDKIGTICYKIYGASNVEYSDLANEQIRKYTDMGYSGLAVCMAKTPNSLTDDAKVLGAPTEFTIHVREVRLSAGAGFIVPLTGAVMTMPGLPKEPLATKM